MVLEWKMKDKLRITQFKCKSGFNLLVTLLSLFLYIPSLQGGWTPPVNISNSDVADTPHVAVNSSGNAVAIWENNNGTDFDLHGAIFDPCTNTWTATSPLTLAGTFFDFTVVLDPAGNAVAAWSRFNGTNIFLQGATLAAGSSTWVATTDLPLVGFDAAQVQLATDPNGNVIAVWTYENATQGIGGALLPFGSSVWTATSTHS